MEEADAQQTVTVGCSLVRAALGTLSHLNCHRFESLIRHVYAGETLL